MKKSIRLKIYSSNSTYTAMHYALIGTICLVVAGCVTAPLKTQQQRDHLAEAIGFQSSEVTLMSQCFFEEVQELDSEKNLRGIRGIVAMTDSEICLMDGAMRMAPTRHFLKIPISEIEGVSGSSGQVQIRYQDRLFVLVVFNWNDFRPNYILTSKIYESLIAANVPQFETRKYYSWSRLSSPSDPWRINNQQDLPLTNLEASRQVFSSQQAAEDRKIDAIYGR